MTTATLKRIELSLDELEAILDQSTQGPLTDEQRDKLRSLLDAYLTVTDLIDDDSTTLRKLRALFRTSEKTSEVCGQGPKADEGSASSFSQDQTDATSGTKNDPSSENKDKPKPPGHGRNGVTAYTGAKQVKVEHSELKVGELCPSCKKGKLRAQSPGVIVKLTGGPPLQATVYERERLRCALCGEVFTAPFPDGVNAEKYDARAAAMIALLKYGSGLPFNRIERLQGSLGVPLPASTQWGVIDDAGRSLRVVFEALVDYAANGDVLHNDDTSMRILALKNVPPSEEDGIDPNRTGIFTSGIISEREGRKIALFFTGRKHAGENLAEVLSRREPDLEPPIQMADALSRNLPKEFEVLLANCLVHGRRNFVNVVENFPDEVRRVLEDLKKVYQFDALARERNLTRAARLELHQQKSKPVLEELKKWLNGEIEEKRVEPNSGLGRAITYLNNHWEKLTLFLKVPGAPLDNNICERSLKRVILHRKNALFYKTTHGAKVGDIFQSLIHTTELTGGNPFEYLTELLEHRREIEADPEDWLPWNYQDTLASLPRA